MKILNHTRNAILATNAQLADTFISRSVGLLKHKHLASGEGLVITRCQQIHMFFMRFAIDVAFVDRSGKVVGLVNTIKPGQMSAMYWRANRAIELPSGTIAQTKTALGDEIQFIS